MTRLLKRSAIANKLFRDHSNWPDTTYMKAYVIMTDNNIMVGSIEKLTCGWIFGVTPTKYKNTVQWFQRLNAARDSFFIPTTFCWNKWPWTKITWKILTAIQIRQLFSETKKFLPFQSIGRKNLTNHSTLAVVWWLTSVYEDHEVLGLIPYDLEIENVLKVSCLGHRVRLG